MTTSPFDPSVCVTDAGVFMPTMEDILAWLVNEYTGIYGADADFSPESPDGQWTGLEAQAFADMGKLLQLGFDALAYPDKCTNSMLSNLVLLNGIRRRLGSPTTVTCEIQGAGGASVDSNFIVRNTDNGKLFSPQSTIAIPANGSSASGLFVCRENGPNTAAAGKVSQIMTVISGIVAVTNPLDGTQGTLVESDAHLRTRRVQSVALPSQSMTEGLQAELTGLEGVRQAVVWENDSDDPVAMTGGTLDPHSIYAVVDVVPNSTADPSRSPPISPNPVAAAIFLRESGGCTKMGSIESTVTDSQGHSRVIHWDKPDELLVYIEINLTKRSGWVDGNVDLIKDAIEMWKAGSGADGNHHVPIGGDANGELAWTDILASFVGQVHGFNFTSIKLGTTQGGGTIATNLAINFNQIARIDTSRITVNAT